MYVHTHVENIHTGVEERLDATSSSNMKAGTAAMDRNGYRYYINYDKIMPVLVIDKKTN